LCANKLLLFIIVCCLFSSYFDCIDVCKYKPEWSEVTLEGQFASPPMHTGEVCHMSVLDPTELDITLFQQSNR